MVSNTDTTEEIDSKRIEGEKTDYLWDGGEKIIGMVISCVSVPMLSYVSCLSQSVLS